jgi:hypothetical protein
MIKNIMSQKTFTCKAVTLLLFCLLTSKMSAQNLTLLPPIPNPATNPHLSSDFSGLNLTSTAFSNDENYNIGLAYLHPNSPYKNQPAVLNRWLLLCDSAFTRWNKNVLVNDFAMMYTGLSYYMLKTYLPDKIPAAKKAIQICMISIMWVPYGSTAIFDWLSTVISVHWPSTIPFLQKKSGMPLIV